MTSSSFDTSNIHSDAGNTVICTKWNPDKLTHVFSLVRIALVIVVVNSSREPT